MNSIMQSSAQGKFIYDHGGPKEVRWSPYEMNGGTCLGVAGEDFVVIAADTRLSRGFSIHTRDSPRTYQLTNNCIQAAVGFHGDAQTLVKEVKAKVKMYEHQHHTQPTTPAIAAMLSTMLYYRRFFPYYVYNIVAGLDDEGKGAIFSYDPVGSYDRVQFMSGGSSSSLIQPLLDSQIGQKNLASGVELPKLTKERAIQIAKDSFISAAERDIYTGDSVEICIIDKDGITKQTFPLRRD